jgi:hypothetical protein
VTGYDRQRPAGLCVCARYVCGRRGVCIDNSE